ncbi:MAG: 1-aminocyclopropane-1-carboxylate deaminase [Dokdonia sp.]|jgi:1-aminocyclopropane-1-carboxylate deaminase
MQIRTDSIPLKTSGNHRLSLRREDLLHPEISGNKFRKLKYTIAFAKAHRHQTLVTFGGAFSNHIAATAAAGKLHNLKTVGIIRGEELGKDIEKTLAQNATLTFARSCGMVFKFVTRTKYQEKEQSDYFQELLPKWDAPLVIPEGGTSALAIKGCEEILTPEDDCYDYICCSVGTGGTIAGIINSAKPQQKVLGFPALKGDFLHQDIQKMVSQTNWDLITNYHFGGYAKVDEDLIQFINDFKKETGTALDPVYTGKLLYGVYDLIKSNYFSENSRILAIHTGGLQGIAGMNLRLAKKGLQLIHI